MILTNIILGFLLIAASLFGFYWALLNRRQYKKNAALGEELYDTLGNALDVVRKNKAITEQLETPNISDLYNSASTSSGDLNSPVMLSTIITVLVSKYGNIRLSVNDFLIPDNEYVSVYVDGDTRELILSLDHDLTEPPDYSIFNLPDGDDNTFH